GVRLLVQEAFFGRSTGGRGGLLRRTPAVAPRVTFGCPSAHWLDNSPFHVTTYHADCQPIPVMQLPVVHPDGITASADKLRTPHLIEVSRPFRSFASVNRAQSNSTCFASRRLLSPRQQR